MHCRLRNIIMALGSLLFPLVWHASVSGEEIKDFELALTKGQYAIELKEYDAAIEHLKAALALRPKDRTARVSLAIAYSRTEAYAQAKEILQQVVAEDPENARARYELGVVLAHLKEWGEANRLLATVSALSGSDELTGAAQELLEDLHPRKTEGGPGIRIVAGMQHDSNVILEPDAPVQPMGRRSDWRGIFSLYGTYPLLRPGSAAADLNYQFYQSLHLELEDYNVQQHDLALNGRYQIAKDVAASLGYAYVLSFVGGEKYSQTHRFEPSVTFAAGPNDRFQVHGRWEDRHYFDDGELSGNAGRSGTSLGGGLVYTHLFTKDTNAAVGYGYEKDTARAEQWDAQAHKAAVTVRSRFGAVSVFGRASIADWRYGRSPVPFYPDRRDRRWDVTAGMFHDLSKTLRLSVADQYIVNDSTLGAYEYRRNILGLFVEMRL